MLWSSRTHLELTLCCPGAGSQHIVYICLHGCIDWGKQNAPPLWVGLKPVGCMPIQILPQHFEGASEQVGTIYIIYVHGRCTCWSTIGSLGGRVARIVPLFPGHDNTYSR